MVWAPAGPERFRLAAGPVASPAVADSGLNALSTPDAGAAAQAKGWHPSSPMFAFGALGLVTFGLMAFSTSGSVRVGKAKLTAGLGVDKA
jgi:hypothetical protein